MTDATPTEIIFNPLVPGYVEDPYPHLGEMRAADPVHNSPIGSYMFFRYEDCFELLRDPALSVDEKNQVIVDQARADAFLESVGGDEARLERTSILGIDPPDHTRLRRLVSKAFTPRTIEALRPRIEELVHAALDEIADSDRPDVIASLAFPLPFDVISEMLGMPPADTEQLRSWSEDIVKTIDPIISEEEIYAAAASNQAMDAHLLSLIHI